MKKLTVLLLSIVLTLGVMAQKHTYVPENDTLTNAETLYFTLDQTVPNNYVAAFGVTVTGLTGTETVTATLQEYVESGKWVNNGSAVALITAGDVASASHIFKLTDTQCLGYRVALAQTGTATSKIEGKFVVKKK